MRQGGQRRGIPKVAALGQFNPFVELKNAEQLAKLATRRRGGGKFRVNLLKRLSHGLQFKRRLPVGKIEQAAMKLIGGIHASVAGYGVASHSPLPSKMRMSWMTDSPVSD